MAPWNAAANSTDWARVLSMQPHSAEQTHTFVVWVQKKPLNTRSCCPCSMHARWTPDRSGWHMVAAAAPQAESAVNSPASGLHASSDGIAAAGSWARRLTVLHQVSAAVRIWHLTLGIPWKSACRECSSRTSSAAAAVTGSCMDAKAVPQEVQMLEKCCAG